MSHSMTVNSLGYNFNPYCSGDETRSEDEATEKPEKLHRGAAERTGKTVQPDSVPRPSHPRGARQESRVIWSQSTGGSAVVYSTWAWNRTKGRFQIKLQLSSFKIWFQNRRAKCRRQESSTQGAPVATSNSKPPPLTPPLHRSIPDQRFQFPRPGPNAELPCMCGHPSLHFATNHVQLLQNAHSFASVADMRAGALMFNFGYHTWRRHLIGYFAVVTQRSRSSFLIGSAWVVPPLVLALRFGVLAYCVFNDARSSWRCVATLTLTWNTPAEKQNASRLVLDCV